MIPRAVCLDTFKMNRVDFVRDSCNDLEEPYCTPRERIFLVSLKPQHSYGFQPVAPTLFFGPILQLLGRPRDFINLKIQITAAVPPVNLTCTHISLLTQDWPRCIILLPSLSSFLNYLLSTSYVPGIVLDTKNSIK